MAEKVYCDGCTDKGHCPEYKAGAVCVNDRERRIKYKIRDNDYFRVLLEKQGVIGASADEILEGLSNLNLDYTLSGRPGCYPDSYELETPEGEKLNVNEQNGYVRGVVLNACVYHFRTGEGADQIHGTFEVISE